MSLARCVTDGVALVCLAAGMTCCGEVGYTGPVPPANTQKYPSETASPLPSGVDVMAGLQQRPMRPPTLGSDGTCAVSSTADLGPVAPNYGAGAGPAYLSGQTSWYAGGQAAILMVDAEYSGPLLVRPFQLGGTGKSTVTLADLPSPDNGTTFKESQHRVAVVAAVHTTGGGLFLGALTPSSSWRAWFGSLSTDSPGCFGLQVDGDVFTEFIVFEVNAGNPPPG